MLKMSSSIEEIRSRDEYRELYELSTIIRNQKLLSDAELDSLTRHKQDVSENAVDLLAVAWRSSSWSNVGRQLKNQTLDPTVACKLLKEINSTQALPAHKHIGHHFYQLDQLITILYNEPLTVAELLNAVDQNDAPFNDSNIQSLFHMVYSCGLYPEDELKLAQVVCHLLKIQMKKSGEQMRTMLRKETSMSTRFYKHFVEQMHPSMVYLTQALRRSVFEVIQLGSFWLDIDSKQSTSRFLRDNKQNSDRLPEYRALVVSKLVELVDSFLEDILKALPMLPPNLNWIVRDIYCSLCKELDNRFVIELSHACKDMIVSNLICPAIISPQKFGVVDNDVRIGTIVNHNLVQVAMIIQMVSMREFETPPAEYQEFLRECRSTHLVSSMMDAILVEKVAPDVEIITLIASQQEKSDMTPKTHFVGSVADANTLIKLVSLASPVIEKNVWSLSAALKKLPSTLGSTVPKKPVEVSPITSQSTFRTIHQKVQHSLKRSPETALNNQTNSVIEADFFKEENFALFFLEYSLKNYVKSDISSTDGKDPKTSSSQNVVLVDVENCTKDSSIVKNHTSNLDTNQLDTPPLSRVSLPLQSNDSIGSLRNNEETDSLKPSESRTNFLKLKTLSEKMRKGITQSNTLADIRGHLWRSGTHTEKESGMAPSSSDQMLSKAFSTGGPRNDILEKYASSNSLRKRSPASKSFTKSDTVYNKKESLEPYYCPVNIVGCRAFQDTVRKMIIVLGNVSYLPRIGYRQYTPQKTVQCRKFLLDQFLNGVLVETEHRRDYGQAAQLREVKRCIELFDNDGVDYLMEHLKMKGMEQDKVIADMREERACLMRKANDISSLEQRVLLNQRLTEELIVDCLARTFLETGFHTKHVVGKTPEVAAVLKFYDEFKILQAHDERAEFLQSLLAFLKQRLLQNSDWSYASNTMVLRAMTTIERYVMFSVYDTAFYPNKELDQHKDKLLRVTIANVAGAVTPENDYLKIPERLHGETPWPSAQAELAMLDFYITAQDKLNCIVRCCNVINNLISLSSKNAVASADDLTPVLVFVIIKANPRALLSNLQFVETFAGERIKTGRDAYYWTIFKSSVEYIKTIL